MKTETFGGSTAERFLRTLATERRLTGKLYAAQFYDAAPPPRFTVLLVEKCLECGNLLLNTRGATSRLIQRRKYLECFAFRTSAVSCSPDKKNSPIRSFAWNYCVFDKKKILFSFNTKNKTHRKNSKLSNNIRKHFCTKFWLVNTVRYIF